MSDKHLSELLKIPKKLEIQIRIKIYSCFWQKIKTISLPVTHLHAVATPEVWQKNLW